MNSRQKLLIIPLSIIAGLLVFLATDSIFDNSPIFATTKQEEKVEEKTFGVVQKTDANLVKDISYVIPGTLGLSTQSRTIRPTVNQQEYSGTKEDKDAEELVKASFQNLINAIKSDIFEDIKKLSAEEIQSIDISNKTKLDNITLSEIKFNKSGLKVTEKNNPVIYIGYINIKQGNCFNLERSLTLKYDTWSKDYKFSNLVQFADAMCEKYVPPASPVTATCTDCKYYPLDKLHRLTADYAPTIFQVSQIQGGAWMNVAVKNDLLEMYNAAKAAGNAFQITSGYRSYYLQVNTYNSWVATELAKGLDRASAEKEAARYSALPGHSEHQLGNAMDVSAVNCGILDSTCPGNVKFFAWMRENAYKYGFALSYPEGKEGLTGYIFEPWHYRWIGKELAAEYHKYENQTYLAEFLRFKKLY